MRKSKKLNAPPPRPEAAPLPFKRLTEAQRKAGEDIAAALQRMANERVPSASTAAQEHPYLPHIAGMRSNRVLLIDGARGTGKSTILVTLLNIFGQQVIGEQPPENFDAVDDRIIPIGIVDLQPLPPQTNLPLHIAGHLKRVVEAVDPPAPVTTENAAALWDEQSPGQLREKWHRLTRLLATWDESLEGRLGRPDMSAYIIETIEEEIERGQLPERFREAVDALVDGYARRFHRSSKKKPLFLLAIDDADMNPRLSVKLLELLRKLWHPRLAFLVAGDSELFLSRLQESLSAQGSRAPREQESYRKLAEDMYAKDIPSSARFWLTSLTPGERVKRIKEIRKLLRKYTVEAHPPERLPSTSPSPHNTLQDYLLVNQQSAELLPDRLREIDELTARLRRDVSLAEEGASSSAAHRVIKWLWDQTVEQHAEEHENPQRLIDAVMSSRLDGRLRLDLELIRLRSSLEPATKIQAAGSRSIITLQDLNRFQAFANLERYVLESALGSKMLEEPLTACWLLAADVAADVIQSHHQEGGFAPFGKGSLQFVVATWSDPHSDASLMVPWALPAWSAPVDYVLFAQRWRELLNSGHPQRTQDAGLVARQFLWLALQLARSRAFPDWKAGWWQDVPDWPRIAEELATVVKQADASPRQQVNAQWATEEAVLLAAPESCLPVEEARSFLDAWTKQFGPLTDRVQRQRLERATQLNPSRSDVEGVLDDINTSMTSHPFVQAMKGLNETSNHRGETTDLWNSLSNLEAPHLKPLVGKGGDAKLSHYRTELRQRALGSLSRTLSSAARLEIERHRRISESTPLVLMGLWRVLAEKLSRPGVLGWFSLHHARILISEEASTFGAALRESIFKEREGGEQSIPIDTVRTLFVERVAPVRRSPELPPPLDALFRLIFDYVQDQEDASRIPDRSLDLWTWPIVSTRFHPYLLHPWPAVRWLSLKEYERFARDWSEKVDNLKGWLELDATDFKPYAADALALSYLWDCYSSREFGGSRSIASHSTSDDFSDFLKRLEPSKDQGRRSQLFDRWVHALPLMGTPEAGLSDPIAQVFIQHALSSGKRPERLRQLRRVRMRVEGVPEDQIETIIARIDQSFSKHPWVETVENHGPAPEGAPQQEKPRS